jgi:hypothetical protein
LSYVLFDGEDGDECVWADAEPAPQPDGPGGQPMSAFVRAINEPGRTAIGPISALFNRRFRDNRSATPTEVGSA